MPPKRKSDVFTSNIPWEKVNANTLRTLCKDIGVPSNLTKQAMIQFLHDVEQHGVDVSLEKLSSNASDPSPEPSKPATRTASANTRTRTMSLKRKKPEPAPADEEDDEENEAERQGSDDNALPYNTRHKGQKRVRVTAPPLPKVSTPRRKSTASRAAKKDVGEETAGETSVTPAKRAHGRPRKSAVSAPPAKTEVASGSAVKRGRGRPRKQPASSPKKAAGSGKQVFDGVELKRARTRETTEDDDADGEPDDEVFTLPNGETSSLGSSNKENNPELVFAAQEEIVVATEVVSTQVSLADAINQANELSQAS